MGISEQAFWHMNVRKLKPYFLADNIRKEEKNYNLWLQGVYFLEALYVGIGNSFSGKGSKKLEYRDKPIRITPLTDEEKIKQAEEDRQRLIAYLDGFEKSFNSRKGR